MQATRRSVCASAAFSSFTRCSFCPAAVSASVVQTVREAHDISLALQQSVEQLEDVERAFVHVDWKGREGEDEHNYALIASKSKMQADAKHAAEALTGAR